MATPTFPDVHSGFQVSFSIIPATIHRIYTIAVLWRFTIVSRFPMLNVIDSISILNIIEIAEGML